MRTAPILSKRAKPNIWPHPRPTKTHTCTHLVKFDFLLLQVYLPLLRPKRVLDAHRGVPVVCGSGCIRSSALVHIVGRLHDDHSQLAAYALPDVGQLCRVRALL